jgi:hypothetical protein
MSWNVDVLAQSGTTLTKHYCKTIKAASTNDTTTCVKSSSGTAGCHGNIIVWTANKQCTPQSMFAFCTYSCTQTVEPKNTVYDVSPTSTLSGRLGCLMKDGAISVAGATCALGVIVLYVGAEIESLGAATLAVAVVAAVAIECGAVAANAVRDWWSNPCCYSYCEKVYATPSTITINTCK